MLDFISTIVSYVSPLVLSASKLKKHTLHRLPRTFALMDLGVSSESQLCKYSESAGKKGKDKPVCSPTLLSCFSSTQGEGNDCFLIEDKLVCVGQSYRLVFP